MQTLAFLREKYPQAFRPSGNIKPFEIGFRVNLVDAIKDQLPKGMRINAVCLALEHYCRDEEYKKAREVLGNPRINLAGEVVSQVTSEDKNLGKQLIEKQQRQREAALKARQVAKANKKPPPTTGKKPVPSDKTNSPSPKSLPIIIVKKRKFPNN